MAADSQVQDTGNESESHDRITHMDLFNLWRGDIQALRADIDRHFSEMRWLIGIGFAALAVLIGIMAFILAFVR